MGLYIFEGNENSGKTTLINKLMEYRPWFIKCKRHTHKTWYDNSKLPIDNPEHDPYPINWDLANAFFYDWRFFLETISFDKDGFNKASFVFDRCFVTDYVFKKALYEDQITEQYLATYNAYEQKMQSIPHVIFFCKRQIEQDFVDHFAGSRSLDATDYAKLESAYNDWRQMTTLNVIDIDNDNLSINDNINKIVQYIGS